MICTQEIQHSNATHTHPTNQTNEWADGSEIHKQLGAPPTMEVKLHQFVRAAKQTKKEEGASV